MVQHLFPKFLESEEEYRRVEEFWRALFEEVAAGQGQRGEWFSWQSRTFLDGTPTPRDGSPVFDARSQKLARAVRVIQGPPESKTPEIAAWVDTFDFSEDGGPSFTEELVINLSLSDVSARVARSLFEQWMDRSVSRERMEDLVARLGHTR